MNERKKKWLNAYLIFKDLILIGWLLGGTPAYIYLLIFFFSTIFVDGFMHTSWYEFITTFIPLTLAYGCGTFLLCNAWKALNKIIKNQHLSFINIFSFVTVAIVECILFLYIGLSFISALFFPELYMG